jgi:alanine dehydrogenase
MKVGCVKEIKNNEFRVGMTPANVSAYKKAGHRVLIEAGAGLGSGFADEEYLSAGAELFDDPADVWAASEMIIKVKEPLEEEYKYFREGQIVFTYLHLAADLPLTKAMMEAGFARFIFLGFIILIWNA